jgi:hypothetical protein
MGFVIGAILAIVVGIFATLVRLDRDRAFYPTVMIVIASYYALFAVMGGSMQTLGVECVVAMAFVGASVAGFKSTLWLVVAALVGHGVFDLVHGHLIQNAGVPIWWPAFCLAYDVAAAGYLAVLILRNRIPASG